MLRYFVPVLQVVVADGPDETLHLSVGADVVGLGEGGAGIDVRRPFALLPHGDDVQGQISVAGDGYFGCQSAELAWVGNRALRWREFCPRPKRRCPIHSFPFGSIKISEHVWGSPSLGRPHRWSGTGIV